MENAITKRVFRLAGLSSSGWEHPNAQHFKIMKTFDYDFNYATCISLFSIMESQVQHLSTESPKAIIIMTTTLLYFHFSILIPLPTEKY